MATRFEPGDDSVVVVIGSGAGGGTLANELAQKGVDVVCLEAGRRLALDDVVNDFGVMFGRLSWLDRRIGSGDLDPALPLWVCKTVGGTTMHWAGHALRFQDHEWKALSTYGPIAGTSLLDWPIDAAEMSSYYDRAEDKIGVAGTGGRPRLPGNNNFKVMEYGARLLGYERVHTSNMGINPVARDDRPGCQQIGFCMAGCAIGAKWSTLYTEVPKAEATGHFELRPESMALQIQHDAQGKATGVLYVDGQGNEHFQKARAVCIAGNAVETPRLLLNSASAMFPDGLANSSGQVGRNYMRHTTGAVYGIMPGPVHFDRGTQMAGIIMDEAGHDSSRGFAGGYLLQTLPGFGVHGVASFMKPGAWGRAYAEDVAEYRNIACMWLCGEDMPQETNGVTLHPTEKDQYGLPVPVVHFDDHPNDVKMRNEEFKTGRAVYEAAGATKVYERGPFPSGHNMGTTRMSENPRDGVVDRFGQCHDVGNLFVSDGSQFTTGATENPTLTIVALAIRQADHIAEQLRKGEI